MTAVKGSELDAKFTPHAYGHVVNWRVFDYGRKAGLGEFTANGWGHNDGFVNTFVINDDKPKFRRNS